MAYNVDERSEWINSRFETLHLSESVASHIVEEIYSGIMNGRSLPEIMSSVEVLLPQETGFMEFCDLWEILAGLMLELEMPMLKGRSRIQYAEEKAISPWEIGMTDGTEIYSNSRERHMYEFPPEIQEVMYQACSFLNEQDMVILWQYKMKEKIQSEEYIYLLAKAYIINCQYEKAEGLIQSLRKSFVHGKKAAKILLKMLEEGMDIMDDWEEESPIFRETIQWIPLQPYMREKPKIGRNECGSGKKYKKCCGRNN